MVLFAGILILSGMYIVSLNRSRKLSNEEVHFGKLWTIQDNTINSSLLSKVITPQFIGLKSPNEAAVGISAGGQYIDELYREIGLHLYYALGDGAEISEVIGGEKSDLWLSLLTSYNYIYIKYHNPLLNHLIQASGGSISGREYTEYTRNKDVIIYIKDLFIIPESASSVKYQVIARDENGRVYVFIPPTSASEAGDTVDGGSNEEPVYSGIDRTIGDITDISVSIYHDSMKKYQFAYNVKNETGNYIDSAAVIINEEIPVRRISADVNAAERIFENPNLFDSIVRIFNFNPDKLYTYEESGEAHIYVETHGNLKISSDRIIYKARSGKGIPLYELTGYNSFAAGGDIYDITVASMRFIESIRSADGDLIGNNAELRLKNLYVKDDNITLEYSYYYDNIEIVMNGKPYALLIESDGINILNIDFYTLSVSVDTASAPDEKILSYSQRWAADRYLSANNDKVQDISLNKINRINLIYLLDKNTERNITPEWYISIVYAEAETEEDDGIKTFDQIIQGNNVQ